MNSLYQQLNQQQINPSLNSVKQMFTVAKNSNNPQQFMQNMMMQNPQIKSVMDMVSKSGKSPKDLFYAMAKQRGVDPQQILNALK